MRLNAFHSSVYPQPVGARAADEVIEAAATRLQSLDVKIYSA
jgi:hypothetical protein